LITVTGWSWEYIDESMTIPRMNELTHYWQQSPPIHLAFKHMFGDVKEPVNEKPNEEDLQGFISQFNAAR